MLRGEGEGVNAKFGPSTLLKLGVSSIDIEDKLKNLQ